MLSKQLFFSTYLYANSWLWLLSVDLPLRHRRVFFFRSNLVASAVLTVARVPAHFLEKHTLTHSPQLNFWLTPNRLIIQKCIVFFTPSGIHLEKNRCLSLASSPTEPCGFLHMCPLGLCGAPKAQPIHISFEVLCSLAARCTAKTLEGELLTMPFQQSAFFHQRAGCHGIRVASLKWTTGDWTGWESKVLPEGKFWV